MLTFSSIEVAMKYLENQFEQLEKESKDIETRLFKMYAPRVYWNVPVWTGATRQFPTKNRAKSFVKNTLVWEPKNRSGKSYTPYIYWGNKSGKPEWDMYTAEGINDSATNYFVNEVFKFIK